MEVRGDVFTTAYACLMLSVTYIDGVVRIEGSAKRDEIRAGER